MAVIHVGYSRDHFFDPIRELDEMIRTYITDLPDPGGPLVWKRISLLPTGTFGADGHKFVIVPAAKRAWVRSTITSKARQRVGLCKTCRVGKYPEILDLVHAISEWELDL